MLECFVGQGPTLDHSISSYIYFINSVCSQMFSLQGPSYNKFKTEVRARAEVNNLSVSLSATIIVLDGVRKSRLRRM